MIIEERRKTPALAVGSVNVLSVCGDSRRITNMKIRIKNPIWGVPITFLDKYNPEQFRIITMSTMSGKSANYWSFINGKSKYSRIFIQKKEDI